MLTGIDIARARAQKFRDGAKAIEFRQVAQRSALKSAREARDKREEKAMAAVVANDQIVMIMLLNAAENLEENSK